MDMVANDCVLHRGQASRAVSHQLPAHQHWRRDYHCVLCIRDPGSQVVSCRGSSSCNSYLVCLCCRYRSRWMLLEVILSCAAFAELVSAGLLSGLGSRVLLSHVAEEVQTKYMFIEPYKANSLSYLSLGLRVVCLLILHFF